MEKLIIQSTEISPEINFDHVNHSLTISGNSRAENAYDLFMPILHWLREYYEEVLLKNNKEIFDKNPIKLIFKMNYFNSSTSKYLLDIILEVFKYHNEGYKVDVEWYYNEFDTVMLDIGEELSDIVEYPFKYIEVKDE